MAENSVYRGVARKGVRALSYGLVAVAGYAWRRSNPRCNFGEGARAILVIRLDLLGDVLFSMQAVEGLRATYPDARVVMLTLPYTAELARRFQAVDEVLTVDTNRIRTFAGLLNPVTWLGYWQVVRRLRREKFDLAVSLSGRMASLWAALSGAARAIGYENEAFPHMLTEAVQGGRYGERKHEVEYVRTLAVAGGADTFPSTLQAPALPAAPDGVKRLLSGVGIGDSDTLVLVHAGSVNGSAKRWPASHWSRFADSVTEKTGAHVVLVGAKSDLVIAEQVRSGAASKPRSLVGRTSIEELIALMERADLVATGDSGPLHLAVALGKPLLAVYGPTDPKVHGPFNPTAPVELHRRDLVCSPCYSMAASAECPLGDPICMRLVTVEQMVDSAVRLLNIKKA